MSPPSKYIIVIGVILLLVPGLARAQKFNPNFLISDREMFDSQSFSRTAIQRFLEQKKSVLAGLTDVFNGLTKKISEIIWEAGQANTISPKFLLTKLQHEQGLIESSTASQRALDWATGYSCFNNRTCNEKYRGLAKQIDAAAGTIRVYTEQPNRFKFRVNQPARTQDGVVVTPLNQATANLYIYTPYVGGPTGIGGNYAFWRVWNRYFGQQKHPDGALLKDPSGNYWRLQGGERRRYQSLSTLLSTSRPEYAIEVDQDGLAAYPEGPEIRFANYSVVKIENGDMYLLVDETKRLIVSSEAFRQVGFNPEEVLSVKEQEIASFRTAFPIDETSPYPVGVLAKDLTTNTTYFVQNGFKYPIFDQIILDINYPNASFISVSPEEMSRFGLGPAQTLRDGIFIQTPDSNRYVIFQGKKLKIANDYTLNTVFGAGKLNQVIKVSQTVADIHPEGETIELIENIPDPITPPPTPDLPPPPIYKAVPNTIDSPVALLPEQTAVLSLSYINNSSIAWPENMVLTILTDQGNAQSDFYHSSWPALEGRHLPQEKTIAPKTTATFTFTIQAPKTPGEYTLVARLKRFDTPTILKDILGGLIVVPITVEPTNTAVITRHTLPQRASNLRRRYPVSITIKNTGRTTWTRRKLALLIEQINGQTSSFYDPADWVSSKIAAVPTSPKQTEIKPGQSATLYFTLKTAKLKRGRYTLKLKLWQKDKDATVYLKNQETWTHNITIVGT